jgi:hypothetical protein
MKVKYEDEPRRIPATHFKKEPDNCRWATPKIQNNDQQRQWVKQRTPEEIEALEQEAKKCVEADAYSIAFFDSLDLSASPSE